MDEALEWVKRVPFTGNVETEVEIGRFSARTTSAPSSRRSCGRRKNGCVHQVSGRSSGQ